MDGGTDGHGLIRVHVFAWLFAEEGFHRVDDFRHACLAADENHVVDFVDGQSGIFQRNAARLNGFGDEVFHQRLKLGTRDFHRQMFRAGRVHGDVRLVDFGLLARRQFNLRSLSRCLDPLQRNRVFGQINAALLFEFIAEIVDQTLIEIFAAKEGVAIGGEHFKLLFAVHIRDLDDRYVEGAAAEVIDGKFAVFFYFVNTEREGCCGRLVDDAFDL